MTLRNVDAFRFAHRVRAAVFCLLVAGIASMTSCARESSSIAQRAASHTSAIDDDSLSVKHILASNITFVARGDTATLCAYYVDRATGAIAFGSPAVVVVLAAGPAIELQSTRFDVGDACGALWRGEGLTYRAESPLQSVVWDLSKTQLRLRRSTRRAA